MYKIRHSTFLCCNFKVFNGLWFTYIRLYLIHSRYFKGNKCSYDEEGFMIRYNENGC